MDEVAQGDEAARLASLAACVVLDTARETTFDNIVFTVAQLFRTPMAMLTLVDSDRVWLKSHVGPLQREYRRSESFCNTIVRLNTLCTVEDTSADMRFAHLPVVTGTPSIRFIAGAPLRGPGAQPIGALCVMDRTTRTVTDRQRAQLLQLAHEAGELLRLRVPDLDLDLDLAG